MSIKLFIPPIITALLYKMQAAFRRTYAIGLYRIKIPPHIALPDIQKKHTLYDRFLPVLAKHLDSKKLIIDVGANIGDTAIAILQQCQNPMLCVEASDYFYSYLTTNIQLLNANDAGRITTIKKMVGTGVLSGALNRSNKGTASLQVEENTQSQTHTPVDEVVSNVAEVILLKVDTDGFDFDVIQSADRILSQSQPVLYWENEISQDFQFEGYSQMYTMLQKKGYKHLFIFDNYGNLMSEESGFAVLQNINSYVYSMKKNKHTRTIYYTDVLACANNHVERVRKSVEEYKKEWIHK